MNVDSVRALCLSFSHATESLQWGEELCFKLGGKLFAVLGLSSVPPRLTFKCDPESFAELTEREGISPARYVGRYKWVTLERLDVLDDLELQDLVRQSYQMVATKVKAPARNSGGKSRKRGGQADLTQVRKLG
jgi:predicted DNA-binding protein (MmcQ/YjbR family)